MPSVDVQLTKGLAQVLSQEPAPVGVLEDDTAVHCHHQAARELQPVLQAQHRNQQGGRQPGTAARNQPADRLDLQYTQGQRNTSTCLFRTESYRSL